MFARKLNQWAARGAAVLAIAAFCLPVHAQQSDFNVRFSWKLKGEYGPYYVAQDKGYYEREGLKVRLGEGAGAQAALGALLQGQEDAVVLPGMFAMTAIAKGMPIKLVALYAPRASTILLSYPDKPVRKPADMEGKVLATAVGEIHTEYMDAFCKINGIDCEKIKRVRVSIQARIPQLLARQVDIAGVQANNDLPLVKKLNPGIDFVEMNLADFGLVLPGMAIAVSDRQLADPQKSEAIVRFLRATNEAVGFVRKDAEESAASMRRLWPGAPDQDVVADQIRATAELVPEVPGKPPGWVQESDIRDALKVLDVSGQLPKPMPPSDFYTNSLLERSVQSR